MILSSKALGDVFDVVIVNHDPTQVATKASFGSLIIYHAGSVVKWFSKDDDGETTNVSRIILKNKHAATTNPGVSDDETLGYSVGSEWINISTNKWYKCKDASSGSADWKMLN